MVRWIYLALLVSLFVYVFWKGRTDERLVAATMLLGSFSTYFIYRYVNPTWLGPSIPLLANEAVITAIFLFVAYRSDRYWPLPVAALQMLSMITPLAKLLGQDLTSYGLGVSQSIWAYPQFVLLIAATYMGQLRRKATSTTLQS